MVVLNGMSRFDLAKLAMKHVPRLRSETADVADMFDLKLYEHRGYIRENFEDLPEIANWSWTDDFSDPAAPPPLAVGQPRAALFTDS
jgi:xylulose-5-phosphate/fructose-6-phosphate phosphoketolase